MTSKLGVAVAPCVLSAVARGANGTHTMTHRSKSTGTRLGADCGDVTPRSTPAA
ncbi:MAG TPA: hypothetical protein VN790_05210 [Steroidobacteraceae bacterium]|nr:hypothetical protein [Steroidobacteraceae bacterium]